MMSPLPRWLGTQGPASVAKTRHVREGGCLYRYHTPRRLPPLPSPSLKCHHPSSPTVLSPSELTAICALRNTPHLFCFFPPLDVSSTLLIPTRATGGFLQLFHVRDPPNKPTLVHHRPPVNKISSEAAIWEDLCWFSIEFQNWLGLKTVITHSYTFCNWGSF